MSSTRSLVLAVGACLLALGGIALRSVGTDRKAAAEETVRLGGLRVTVWSRPSAPNVREPVLIFSHGFHGCSTQSRYLMEAFASDGYLVVAPNHADATCNGGTAKWTDPPEVSFGSPQAWSDSTFAGRRDDIRSLIAAIPADPRFGPRADVSRLALSGHSLGGYTALGLVGAWASWSMAGVRAVLALSPYDQAFLAHATLEGLTAPVMYQGGTLDVGITPSVEKPGGGYDRSPQPKYFAEFSGAGHLAWTNIGNRAPRDAIVAYSLAFVDHYVKGEPAAPLLTEARPGVSLYRYASELGSNGAGRHGGR